MSIVAAAASAATSTITTSPASPASVTVGTAVTVTVQLKDAGGNNLATSGGTVVIARTGTGSLTATTDNGNGTYTATLNSAVIGSATISATVNGTPIATGNPTVTYNAGAATQIAQNGGDNQSATAGAQVPTRPSVVVRDANGTRWRGVGVTFAIGLGAGSLTGAGQTTNSSGIATVGSWTLGTATGANTLTATSGALTGSPITFTATSIVGPASAVTSTITAPVGAVTSGGTKAITVTLKDANGNTLATSGGTVVLTPSIGTITGLTDNGTGTWSATYNATTAGSATVSGTINGSAMTSVLAITVNAGSATQIAVSAGNGQSATAGSAVTTPPAAVVRDLNNNPVQGVNVTFAVTGGGGAVNRSPRSPRRQRRGPGHQSGRSAIRRAPTP